MKIEISKIKKYGHMNNFSMVQESLQEMEKISWNGIPWNFIAKILTGLISPKKRSGKSLVSFRQE